VFHVTTALVTGARLAPSPVPSQFVGCDVELLRQEGDDCLGNGAQIVGAEAREAVRAELQGEPRAVGGRGRARDLGAVRAGQGEVGLDVAGSDLGWKAVEPLAFRVAEEPDGHGGLLRGAPPRGFSQTNVSEKTRYVGATDTKPSRSACRKPLSESLSRKCTGTMGFEKEDGKVPMRIGYARVEGLKRRMTPGKVESARKLLNGGMAPRVVAQNLSVSIPALYRWIPASSR
jgi:hypothetical protein